MTDAMRSAFERAAPEYDAHDALPREVGRRLVEHLDGLVIDPALIVDLGCGTGTSFEALRERYPRARIAGLDFVHAMLRRASARVPWWKRALGGASPVLACADAHRLPLAAGCAQFVFSNLMLQWCRAETVFAEVARVLAVDGLFMFSTFGPDTLKELRAAFAAAGEADRVNPFVDMHDLGDALVQAGFADPVMEMEMLTLEYDTLDALLGDLRGVGSSSRAGKRPIDGAQWQAIHAEYEKYRRGGVLPSTYEVVYGHAWKAAPRRTADGRQVIEFRERR